MKKFTALLAITTLLFACSKPQTFEDKAKAQMYKTFSENIRDVKISNEKVVWSTDSLCIIQSHVEGRNQYGGETSDNIEYIYFQSKEDLRESIIEIDKHQSIIERATVAHKEMLRDMPDSNFTLKDHVVLCVILETSFSGHKLERQE